MKNKRVRVAITFERVIEVPEDWDQHQVEFYLVDSAHCLTEDLRDEVSDQDSHEGICTLCGRATARVLDMDPPPSEPDDE